MADIQTKYGPSNQPITITVASLPNLAARASTAINNATTLALDALVFFRLRTASALVSATGFIEGYAYGSADGGASYTEGATGTDAAITLTSPPNVRPIGIINAVAPNVTYLAGPVSVAAAFGGVLPERWGIILRNNTGAALQSVSADHAVFYQNVFGQSV